MTICIRMAYKNTSIESISLLTMCAYVAGTDRRGVFVLFGGTAVLEDDIVSGIHRDQIDLPVIEFTEFADEDLDGVHEIEIGLVGIL